MKGAGFTRIWSHFVEFTRMAGLGSRWTFAQKGAKGRKNEGPMDSRICLWFD